MALIKCKECGKEVSSEAESCPHCGIKIETGGGFFKVLTYIFLTIGGIIFLLIALFIMAITIIPPI
ncbi:MAG: zinc ribbon domain-containing protein [bacterium]